MTVDDEGAPRPRTWILAVLFTGLIVGGVLVGLHVLGSAGSEPLAPDFTIETVRHGNFTLGEHRGSVVVVDLMAVDCPTCRVTERSLLLLAQEHPDVVIVSVDIWTQFEDAAYLDAHMQKLGADWPYGMDTADNDVFFKYNAFEISKVAVIDAQGVLRWSAVGAITYDRLERAVIAAKEETGRAGFATGIPMGLVGFAVLAGIASFFAPCAFPLLPGYMAYTLALQNKPADGIGPARRALAPGIAAALGILLVYALFGLLVAVLGETARPWLPLLQPAVGILAILLGIALLLGATMTALVAPLQRGVDRALGLVTRRNEPGTLTGYFSYGIGYGAAAAGCTAPVFLQLALTAFVLGFATGLRVFLVYAGTAALLMVGATLVAVLARERLQRHSATIVRVANRLSGVVLLAAGVYLVWFYQRAFGWNLGA